jgi:hypothetical protein
MKFYAWCRENDFALTLNDLSTGIPTYGSIVWKKYYDDEDIELEECNLENLYFKQTSECIRDANVVELHYFTETELRKRTGSWDNVAEAIKKGKEGKKGELVEYEIWERWGEYEDEKTEDVKYMHHIGFGKGDKEIIMVEDEVKQEDMPYYDFHIGKYQGTWQRIGIVERLYNLQVRANQLVNQNATVSEIASLLLLRTNDPNTNGNVLEQAINGQIVNSSDLQQIPLQNQGIANFLQEMALIERQADKLCMTPEVVTGSNMPSGTPFRGMALMSASAKSSFEYIRQSIGECIADILLDEILPEVVKEWNREDYIELANDEADIKIYDDAVANQMKIESMLTGNILSPDLVKAIESKVETEVPKIGRKVAHGKKFFNFEYGIRINPTGESFDLGKQNDAMSNAIQLVLSNPAVMGLPMFKQYLENNGINWWKLTAEQKAELMSGATGQQPNMKMSPQDALMEASQSMGK